MTLPTRPNPLEPLEPRRLLAATLSLDTTWGGDGFVTRPADTIPIAEPIDLAAAADGSVVAIAIGPTTRQVVRYRSDGLLDDAFGTDGRAFLTFDATAVAIAPDGKILLAGANTVLRLEPDGDVDDDFGFGGFVSLTSGGAFNPSGEDMAFAADGDLLLLRSATIMSANPLEDDGPAAIVTRLDEDGDLEEEFGTDGSSVFALPLGFGDVTEPQALAITPDVQVLLGGPGLSFGSLRVVRLDADGLEDPNFELSLSSSAGIVLDAIDTDPAGGVTLLTHDTLGLNTTTVTQFDADQAQIATFTFSRPGNGRVGVSLATPDIRHAVIGFSPYEIARLVSDQLAPGVFLGDDGTLEVLGTGGNDTIVVNRASNAANLRVTRNGQRTFIPRSGVSQIAITGNAGDDALTVTVDIPSIVTGDAGNDAIQTAGGADRIGAGDGNDTVFAGGGKDVVTGGVGADRLYGEGSRDRLAGEGGKDRLFGGSGDDVLDGGAADDYLVGEAGIDQLLGYRGNDTLDGGSSVDSLFGGADTDSAINPGPDLLDAIEISTVTPS